MEASELCSRWGSVLETWSIPEEILKSARESPWKLLPQKFGPTEDRANSPTVAKVRELLRRDGSGSARELLDVGSGAGGFSLLLLDEISKLTAVDVNAEMLQHLREGFERLAPDNVELQTYHGSWIDVSDSLLPADVVLCANVLYNVSDPCGFIRALDSKAKIGVVIEIHERHPHSIANEAWKYFWGLDRPSGPTGEELFEIVQALGFGAQSLIFHRDSSDRKILDDEFVASIRQRICLDETREIEIKKFLAQHPVEHLPSRVIWWEK